MDITFDLALHAAGCNVTTFDPTPHAIEHVGQVAPDDQRFRFLPTGWWSGDETLRFYLPSPNRTSHSALNLMSTDQYIELPVARVSNLMRELGDTHVDIIKMDIEGAEYEVLNSLLEDKILPPVLMVEFDQPMPIRQLFRTVKRLRKTGYDLDFIDRWNYTFVKTK